MLETEQDHVLDLDHVSEKAAKLDNLLIKCSELEENMQKTWEDATIQGVSSIKKLGKIKKVADKVPITMKYTEEYKHMRKNVKNLIHKRFLQNEARDRAIESIIEEAIAPNNNQLNSKILFSFESFKKIPEFKLLHKHKRKFGESWLNKSKEVNMSTSHESDYSLNRELYKFDSPQPALSIKRDLDHAYKNRLNLNKKSQSPIFVNKSLRFKESEIFKTPNKKTSINSSINTSLLKRYYINQKPLRIASYPDMDIDFHHVEKFKLPSIHTVRESKNTVVSDSMIMELLEETFDDKQKLLVEKLIGASHINEQKRKGLGRIPAKSSRKAANY